MPGTTIAAGAAEDAIDEALAAVRFLDAYERTDVLDDGDAYVGHTGYPAYPVRRVPVEGHTVVLEGYLYGTDDVAAALETLVDRLDSDDTAGVGEWLVGRDGDFLVTVRPDGGDVAWVVNDAFGRLPTYRAEVGDATVVTRELKVVRELADGVDGDPLAVAQICLFGYPLGTRTVFEGVRTLPPGSVTRIDDGTDVEQVHRLAFDRYARADVSVEANAESLARTFVEACADRAAVVDETVVSLSGGLDSRAVLAAYDHAEGDLVAATSANEGGSNAREVAVAREVAEAVGVEWQPYVASASDAGRRRLLDMHQGMTHLDTVLGADFVEQVAADHPAAMFVTGDGGDKALPDLTPAASPDSVADLVSTLVTTLARFDLAEAAALTGVRPDDLRASIRDRVESYPEADLDARYVHFLVRERGINQLNHGEERSRYFGWSTSPFYALPFFTQAMACPPAQKRRSRLYRSFLETLSPAAVGVDYVDFGAPIDSLEYRAKKVAYDAIADRPALLSGVKRLLGRGDGDTDPEASTAITDALREGGPETAPLSRPAIQRVAWNGGKYSARQQYIVLTLLGAFSSGDGARTVEAA